MKQDFFKTKIIDKGIDDKVKFWINSFYEEAKLFETANNHEEFWKLYKEEPLTSLFSTGIIRVDSLKEISTLREYPVYSNGAYKGRSDLFINYYKEKKHFFIEAKYEEARHETGFIDWSSEEHQYFFDRVRKQLIGYVDCEAEALIDSYAVVLLFHVVNFKKESDFNSYINNLQNFNLDTHQFLAAFTNDKPINSEYKKFGILEIAGYVEKYPLAK